MFFHDFSRAKISQVKYKKLMRKNPDPSLEVSFSPHTRAQCHSSMTLPALPSRGSSSNLSLPQYDSIPSSNTTTSFMCVSTKMDIKFVVKFIGNLELLLHVSKYVYILF